MVADEMPVDWLLGGDRGAVGLPYDARVVSAAALVESLQQLADLRDGGACHPIAITQAPGWLGRAKRERKAREHTLRPSSQGMPSPGGQTSRMDGVRHPIDLPEGYHTESRGQSFASSGGGCVEGCPRAAARSGVARPTG